MTALLQRVLLPRAGEPLDVRSLYTEESGTNARRAHATSRTSLSIGSDSEVSFAREYVPPPPGLTTVPVDMEPGDVLFFNGSLVHGSQPNGTADRFRRSFIGHYVGRSARRIGTHYRTLTMDGERVPLPESEGAGPCGTEFAPQGPH